MIRSIASAPDSNKLREVVKTWLRSLICSGKPEFVSTMTNYKQKLSIWNKAFHNLVNVQKHVM